MPQPTAGDVHVNSLLTNILVAFTQDENNFIATKVFPMVPVAKQSDRFVIYDRGDWLRSVAEKRGPGSESAGSGWDLDNTPTYFADVWAVHKDVDDQTRANSDPVINLDRDATRWVGQQLLMRMDKEWTSAFFTTGVWDTDFTPGTLWDAASATIVRDINDQQSEILRKTGRKANKFVMSNSVWQKVRNDADIIDRIKHVQRGIVTQEIFAGLIDVDTVLIANAIEATSAEGAADVTAFIATGKDALLVYAASAPSVLEPTGGYTFTWTGIAGGTQGMRIKNFRLERESSDRIEGESAFDMNLVSKEAGIFFDDVIA